MIVPLFNLSLFPPFSPSFLFPFINFLIKKLYSPSPPGRGDIMENIYPANNINPPFQYNCLFLYLNIQGCISISTLRLFGKLFKTRDTADEKEIRRVKKGRSAKKGEREEEKKIQKKKKQLFCCCKLLGSFT